MRLLLACFVAALPVLVHGAPARTTITARALHPGEVVALSVNGLEPGDVVTIRAFERDMPVDVSPAEAVALFGIDLETRPGPYTVRTDVRHADGSVSTLTDVLTVRAKAFPTRRLTVEPKYVAPPPAAVARIAAEAQRLESIWTTSAPARLWNGAFIAPVIDRATSAFGSRSIFNGQPRSPHAGADFASPAGRPVFAPNAGRVVLADDLYFTGRTVVVDHGLGLVSLFAHLSEYAVREGDVVDRGARIGRVGATGRVTGPHLHWTVRLGGARVDPLSLIAVTARTSEETSRER